MPNIQNSASYENNIIQKIADKKMPIYHCSCGAQVLIVPDVAYMSKAILNHIRDHHEAGLSSLTEEMLIRDILKTLSESSFK